MAFRMWQYENGQSSTIYSKNNFYRKGYMKMIAALALVMFLGACETRTPDADVTTDSTTVVVDSTVPLDTVVTQ